MYTVTASFNTTVLLEKWPKCLSEKKQVDILWDVDDIHYSEFYQFFTMEKQWMVSVMKNLIGNDKTIK